MVYFLNRILKGFQCMRLSKMQFYNTIYKVTQYNNTINTTNLQPHPCPGNYVVSEFTVALQTLMNRASSGFTVSYSNIMGLITIAGTYLYLRGGQQLRRL